MTILHAPRFLRWASHHLLCRVEGVDDRFALTFDDGPSTRNTPALLDVLAAHRARATFFVLGRHVRIAPAVVARAAREGHEIGLHGEAHIPLPLMPRAMIIRHLHDTAHIVADITGVWPHVYRPPFGILTPGLSQLLRASGYLPVLGDIYPEDPQKPGVDRIVRRVMSRLRGGSIVIMHDASAVRDFDRGQTIAAVDQILQAATAHGLRAIPAGELATMRGITAASFPAGANASPSALPPRDDRQRRAGPDEKPDNSLHADRRALLERPFRRD